MMATSACGTFENFGSHFRKRLLLLVLGVQLFWNFCNLGGSHQAKQVAEYSYQTTQQDSFFKMSCQAFIDTLYNGRNLVSLKRIATKATVRSLGNGVFELSTFANLGKHVVKYDILSNHKFETPNLIDFSRKDFISSRINIDGQFFNIDSCYVEPKAKFGNQKMKTPLSLCDLLYGDIFYYAGVEYLIFQGYPPCNGRSCKESYLFLCSIKAHKIGLKVIGYKEFHPFSHENIFIGDLNGDKTLDYYLVDEKKQNEQYYVSAYSILKDSLIPLNASSEDYNISYSCELCSGALSDTIIIEKK